MKNITFAISFLMALLGSTIVGAQQSPYHGFGETIRFLREQRPISNHHPNRQTFYIDSPALQSHAKAHKQKLNAIIPDFQVNDDQGTAFQGHPSISVNDSGSFVITWLDYRNGNSDIYAQRFANDGIALDTNFKVNDDVGIADQGLPSISTGGGNFVITWMDLRNGDSDIYAQRYSNPGNPLGINFKVNDDLENARNQVPSISSDSSGNFVIVWMDDRSSGYNDDVYAQRFSSDGSPIGTNFKINDDQGDAPQLMPTIATAGSGNFVITWMDMRDGGYNIYGQRYSSNGSPLGTNFKVDDDPGFANQWFPEISAGNNGNFVITWADQRNVNSDIYAQRYASDGSQLDTNFRVNDVQGNVGQWSPSISTGSNGNFVVTWCDRRNGGYDIYAQRYSSDGTPLGTNFKVTTTAEEYQFDPDIKLWNERIYNAWTDSLAGGSGYDIWANVLDWDNPVGLTKADLTAIPKTALLNQNYPNPFNPKTFISWQLAVGSPVKLTIFNLAGQTVATLVDEFQPADIHSIEFDGSKLASGVYFYKLQAGKYVETRKMVLMK